MSPELWYAVTGGVLAGIVVLVIAVGGLCAWVLWLGRRAGSGLPRPAPGPGPMGKLKEQMPPQRHVPIGGVLYLPDRRRVGGDPEA